MNAFKSQLKKAYDADARRRSDATTEPWKVSERNGFAHKMNDKGLKTLLELGSGTGRDALEFEKYGFNVLATDISEGMVNKCRQQGLNAEVADLYELHSLNKTFDAVFSLNVLLHVPKADIRSVLTEINSVLNDGGLFFYGVYSRGKTEETTIADHKRGQLPRFFSFFADEDLQQTAAEIFSVVDFHRVDIGKQNDFYFQSLTLQK